MKELILKIKKTNYIVVLIASVGALFFGIGTTGVIYTPKYEYVLPNYEESFGTREDLLEYIESNVSQVEEKKYMIEGSGVLITESELELYITSLFNSTIENTIYYTNDDITFDSGVLNEDIDDIIISSELIKGYKDYSGNVQSEKDALKSWVTTKFRFEHKLLNSDVYSEHFETETESIEDYIKIMVDNKHITSRTEYHYSNGNFDSSQKNAFDQEVLKEETTNSIIKTNEVLNTDTEFLASKEYIEEKDNWISDNYVAEELNTEEEYKASNDFNKNETDWLNLYTIEEYRKDTNSNYNTQKTKWETANKNVSYVNTPQEQIDYSYFKQEINYVTYASTDYIVKKNDWLNVNKIKVAEEKFDEDDYKKTKEYNGFKANWFIENPNKEEAYWTYRTVKYTSEELAKKALEKEVSSREVTRERYSYNDIDFSFSSEEEAKSKYKTTIQNSDAEAKEVTFYTSKTGMNIVPNKDSNVNETSILSNLESKDIIEELTGKDFKSIKLKTFISTFVNKNVQDLNKALELYNVHIRDNLEEVSVIKYKFNNDVVIFDTKEITIDYYESIIIKVKK